MTDENLFEEEAKTLLRQIYGLPGLPPSSMEHSFHTIKNALYSAFCDGVASGQSDRNAIVEECAKVMCHRCGDGESPFFERQTWCHPNAMGLLVRCASHELHVLKATPSDPGLKSATRDTVGAEHASASLTQNKTETAE